MRRLLKYTGIVLAVIILLMAAALLLIQTSFFKEKLKLRVISLVKNELNLTLSIEELDGNFYNNIILHQVELRDADSLLAAFDDLKLHYNLRPLFHKEISIDSVVLSNPYVNLWQTPDNTWNFSTILSDRKEPADSNKTFPFAIEARQLAIRNGKVDIASHLNGVPTEINTINLFAGGRYRKSETLVRLNNFQFRSNNPDVELKKLSGKLEMNDSGIQVDSLLLVANNSGIAFQGAYFSPENMEGKISKGTIDKNDLTLFVPSFKLLCSPSVKADLLVSDNSLNANAVLQNGEEQLRARLSLQFFTNLQSDKGDVPYQARVEFDNVNIGNWVDWGVEQTHLNGSINLNGQNLKNLKAQAVVNGEFQNSSFNDIELQAFSLDGIYMGDSLSADVIIHSAVGNADLNGKISFAEVPEYEAGITIDKFELSKIVPKLAYTMLNGKVVAKGKGFNPKALLASADISLSESTVHEFPIDSVNTFIGMDGLLMQIDTLQAYAPGAKILGSGQLELDSMLLHSTINGNISSLRFLKPIVDLPVAFDSAFSVATLSGPVSALKIDGILDLFQADGYSFNAKTARANCQVAVAKDSFNVAVQADMQNVKSGNIMLDSVLVDYSYAGEEMLVDAEMIRTGLLNTRLHGAIVAGDTLSLSVYSFELNSGWANVFLPDTMSATVIGNQLLEVQNLTLRDREQTDFLVEVNGKLSTIDTGNFVITINDFDIDRLSQYLLDEYKLHGKLNSAISLHGSTNNPVIEGKIELHQPRYENYELQSLNAQFAYANQEGKVELTIPDLGDSFYAGITAPLSLKFDSLKFSYDLPTTYHGSLILDSVDINRSFKSYASRDSIKGLLNANIEMEGTIEKPQIFGGIQLKDALYINNRLGINYSDIMASVKFDGNRIGIDTMLVKQKNGLISVYGELNFDSTLIAGEINSSSLQVDASNFFLTRHHNYEILIDANTFARTKGDSTVFGGMIKVLRSDLYLPAFMKDEKIDEKTDVPMLVKALESPADSALVKPDESENRKSRQKQGLSLTNKLIGRLQVKIPRNTWIRSNNIRVELNGELEIVKDGPFFEVFGNVKVLRGNYVLYGRKLNIKESEIIFQGGEKFDPILNINAEYVFRSSDKEKRYLDLLITGDLSEPEITFFLDDAEISETDGISVLVLGATSDEIGYGGNNSLLNSIGSNALASMISSQLNKTIGSTLNLDMIEVTSTENWQSAAFVVGKYITNDIFVIYQKGFGEVSGEEITPETVIIEYEINEKLFLRLQSGSAKESGIDMILKFEQEKDSSPVKR